MTPLAKLLKRQEPEVDDWAEMCQGTIPVTSVEWRTRARVAGRVRVLHDGTYVEHEVRHGGKRTNHMGLTALVEIQGRNLLVLTSQRHPPFSLGQLTCLGIQPQQQRILVVKAAIAYKAAYTPIAGTIIEVDTPGLTAVNPARFTYRHIRRPMFPLDGP